MNTQLKIVVGMAMFSFAVLLGLGNGTWQDEARGQSQLSTPELLEAAVAKGEIGQAQADLYLAYALTSPEKLPSQYHGAIPWDGTLPLLDLQERVERMEASVTRAAIEKALSTICSSSTGTLPNFTSSTHFYVEYDTIGGGLNIASYTASLETAWTKEVTTFGWAAPPVLTGNPPPGNLYHVRIDTLGANLYGYVSTSGGYAGLVGNNPNTTWDDTDAYATCMVLNRDFEPFPGTTQAALDATTAHEFNHSIQFGLGALTPNGTTDAVFAEGGASWMEDEVFDSANDNYNYLWPDFTMCMGEYTASPYPYWITWRGLTERYGAGVAGGGEQVMQDFWEETSKGTGNNLSAMNTALINKATTLADAYHAYAIAAKFNKTCGGSYVYPYCFEEAAGYLSAGGPNAVHGSIASVGGSYNGSVQDNYALNWIGLPTSGGPYTVTLQNTSAGGQLRGSLVCDTGLALNVTSLLPGAVGAGGSAWRLNFDPSGCSSVVAVITNQAQTADNPTACANRSYQLKVELGGPAPHFVYLPLIKKDSPSTPPSSLVNGDFESGNMGWLEYSQLGYSLIVNTGLPVTPHSGSWLAWLGGDHHETAYIQQTVGVSAGSPYLAYWHWISSVDFCGFDLGKVLVNGSVVDTYDLCSFANTGGWVKHVVDLSAYAGQSVALQIRAETDSSEVSSLYVDDVAFQTGPAVAYDQSRAFAPARVPDKTAESRKFSSTPR